MFYTIFIPKIVFMKKLFSPQLHFQNYKLSSSTLKRYLSTKHTFKKVTDERLSFRFRFRGKRVVQLFKFVAKTGFLDI